MPYSKHLWDMIKTSYSPEKLLIFVLSGLKLNYLATTAVGTKTSKFVLKNNSDRFSLYFDVLKSLVRVEGTKKPHHLEVTLF